jgi:predicted histidine transporter YuiF (NhaC family)
VLHRKTVSKQNKTKQNKTKQNKTNKQTNRQKKTSLCFLFAFYDQVESHMIWQKMVIGALDSLVVLEN